MPWLSAVASVMAEGEEGKKKQMMKRLIPALLFFYTWNTGCELRLSSIL